jgi:subtilisin-like proprotein convertase family protein
VNIEIVSIARPGACLKTNTAANRPRRPSRILLLLQSLWLFLFVSLSGTLAQGTSSVTLAWDPNTTDPGIVGYELYYGTTSGVYSVTNDVGNVTTATVSGLLPGTTYYFCVTDHNTSGLESPPSNELAYQVPSTGGGAANPVITWATPASLVYGTALSVTQLNATANVAGTFAYNPPTGTVLAAGNGQILTVVFSPTDTTNYTKGTNMVSLNVSQAPLTISANSQSKIYGAVVPALSASYSGFVNGDTAAKLTSPASLATTATVASPAGTYAITAGGAASPNYAIAYANGTLTVMRAPLTITANNQTKVYGAALPTLAASYSGFVNGDTAGSLATPASLTTTATAASPPGTYAITAGGAASPNYTISLVSGSLTVTRANLTITADNKTMASGGPLPSLTASYAGFVNGDAVANLTTPVSLATTATASSPAGTYPITASGATSPNYTIAFVNGTLTVTSSSPTNPIVTWAKPADIVYGTALGASQLSASANVPGTFAYNPPAGAVLSVGSAQVLSVAFTPSDLTNYNRVSTTVALNVQKAPLTISANNQAKVYGATVPVLTASYTGLVNGDTAASLTNSGAPAAIPGLVAAYAFNEGAGTTVTDASGNGNTGTIVNATWSTAGKYGNGLFFNGTSAWVAINDAPSMHLTTGMTVEAWVDPSSVDNRWREVLYKGNDLIYLEAMSPSGAVPVIGAQFGAGGTFVETPGPTPLTANVWTHLAATYDGATVRLYVNGILVSSQAQTGNLLTSAELLTIGADSIHGSYFQGTIDEVRIYNRALSASELQTDMNTPVGNATATPVILATSATASSAAGSYPITVSGGANANYAISYVNGTLTVNRASLTITANSQTKVYGAAVPTLTASYSGFVNGDTAASLTTPVSLTTTAAAASHVGTYAITPSGAAGANYIIAFGNGTLNVMPASLTITADNKSMAKGSAVPTLTASYSGFVNGETASSLTTSVKLTTTATSSSAAGTYPITASGAADADYVITQANGVLTVTPASLVSLAIACPTNSITVGKTQQFTATGTYSDGTKVDLTGSSAWVSSLPGVATINTTGLATALAAGSTVISATQSSLKGSAALNVVAVPTTNTVRFANSTAINIPANGASSPYPSSINVAGLSGTISKMTVTLSNFTHTATHEVNVLLVSPTGSKTVVMANTGGNYSVSNVNLTFDDATTSALPQSSKLVSGTYRPTCYGSSPVFSSPAPAGPYVTNLTTFKGIVPNGTWSLFVIDDTRKHSGSIASGWSLAITTVTGAPASLTQPVQLPGNAGLMTLEPSAPPSGVNVTSPGIGSISVRPGGQVQLSLRGQPGQAYRLLVSSDLINWQEVHKDIVPSEEFMLIEESGGNSAQRFYRIEAVTDTSSQ